MLTRGPALTISSLCTEPFVFYSDEHREYGVAWCSTLMTLEHAIILMASKFLFSYPTPEVKIELYKKFKHLYENNFFGEQQWDSWIREPSVEISENLWKLYHFQTSPAKLDQGTAYDYVLKWLALLNNKV